MKTILRRHLQQTYSEQELRQWFEPLRIFQNDIDKSIQVVFPHPYFAQWFSDTVQQGFEEQLSMLLGPSNTISYSCRQQGGSMPLVNKRTLLPPVSPFGNKFSFDTFIVNNKNHFPYVSAKEIVGQGETNFNPLVICGPQGSGKTHILKAIGNEFSKTLERKNVFLGTVEEIADIYSTSFDDDTVRARKYITGSFSCLLVDDIQRIVDNDVLQEELTILFDHFHDARKQMVFCCSGRLGDLEHMSEALRSRLEWGLIISLKAPDLDIRVKYIQAMCKARRIKLNKEQVLTLAQRFTDLRFLEGILLKLFAFKKLVHKNIQDADFQQILDHAEGSSRHGLTAEEIIGVVAEHFALPVKVLTGTKRDRNIAFARQVGMYLCRLLIGCSYPTLGKHFGGKDHSTVMYAVNKIEKLQADDQDMNRLLNTLKKKCSSLHVL